MLMKTATLGIIIDTDAPDGRVLLGRKSPNAKFGANTYNAPGGALEPGESLLDCLCRELREELSILIDRASVEEIGTIIFWAGGEPDWKVHVYRVSRFDGTPETTESMTPAWFARGALPFAEMLEGDDAWFERAVRGERFCAHVRYRERGKGFEGIEFLPFSASFDVPGA